MKPIGLLDYTTLGLEITTISVAYRTALQIKKLEHLEKSVVRADRETQAG
jgi:hypothetical protein